MSKRIPPKGTPEYRRYWRDRALKRDLDAMQDRIGASAKDCTPEQAAAFLAAFEAMDEVILRIVRAHSHSYVVLS